MKRRLMTTFGSQEGYALLTVTIFAFILLIAGFAFFALVSYETEGAFYRQESSEAFYLADAAVERARAEFLNDLTWRDGYPLPPGVEEGRGSYDLTVTDTTYLGEDVVKLLATGHVDEADRSIEVIADITPTTHGLTMLIMGDTDVNGNFCLEGSSHINGDPDFGPNDVHWSCEGEFTTGFEIIPPPIYTDPDHFPNSTYYYVQGVSDPVLGDFALVYDKNQVPISPALGDSLQSVISYDAGPPPTFSFLFKNEDVDFYFNDETGIFLRNPSDIAAVINFGEGNLFPGSDPDVVSNVAIQHGDTLHCTILNSRFTGGSADSLRVRWEYWEGGLLSLQSITFEPYYGVGAVCFDMEKHGSALVQFGTYDWPALLYVTRDVTVLDANFVLIGSIVVLRDFGNPQITGGPTFIYDPGFIENMPDYLEEGWLPGTSGTMEILRWREIAAVTD